MSQFSKRPPRILTVNLLTLLLGIALSIAAIYTALNVFTQSNESERSHQRYETCSQAATDLMEASDYLTTQARMYVVTGDRTYLDGYLNELHVTRRRNKAVDTLEQQFKGERAYEKLAQALDSSNELAQNELYGMRLTADAYGLSPLPESLERVQLREGDRALSNDEKDALAQSIMFGDEYQELKSRIIESVDECATDLINILHEREYTIDRHLNDRLHMVCVIVVAIVFLMALTTLANYLLIVRPIRFHTASIENNDPLASIGSLELRHVVSSYNSLYEENHRRTMLLKHEAETDALTGLLNRGSYDKLLEHHGEDIALILMDIDLFKEVNDTYGHGVGDEVLKKVGASIADHFRTTDYACRIGGDEFAVIMTEMRNVNRSVITKKLAGIATDLRDTSDELPAVTLSVGIALSEMLPPRGDLYQAADTALYDAKHRGRNRYAFYDEEDEADGQQLSLWE